MFATTVRRQNRLSGDPAFLESLKRVRILLIADGVNAG